MHKWLAVGAAWLVSFGGVAAARAPDTDIRPAHAGSHGTQVSVGGDALGRVPLETLERSREGQPMVTSAYGGAAAEKVSVNGRPRLIITRFVDGQLERTRLPAEGRVRGIQIDDSGRITVVLGINALRTAGICKLFGVSWRPGREPSAVNRIGSGFFCPLQSPVTTLIDAAGNVVVIDRFPDDYYTVIIQPADSHWQEPVRVQIQGVRGSLLGLDLSPNGDLVGLWSDRDDMTGELILTRRGLTDLKWTSSSSVARVGFPVYGANIDAGPADVGFSTQSPGYDVLVGRVDSAGEVSIEAIPQTAEGQWSQAVLTAGRAGSVRVVLDRYEPQTGEHEARTAELTDVGFSSATLGLRPWWNYAVNDRGSILISTGFRPDLGRVIELRRWPAGEALQLSGVALGRRVVSLQPPQLLDSGRFWFRAYTADQQGTYHVLYLLGSI